MTNELPPSKEKVQRFLSNDANLVMCVRAEDYERLERELALALASAKQMQDAWNAACHEIAELRAGHEPRVEHRCQTHLWQGHAACPICNPDKTVPELNRAAQPPATEPCPLRSVVQAVVDWNTKYPSSRIYDEGSIRKIAAEMDAIFEQAKAALAASAPPPASEPCPECEKRKHANDRINYETTKDGFRICRGYHHRSADCEWEYYIRRPAQPPATEPPAEPDQAAMDRIFDSWFDSLPEPPKNYHQIFVAGYAAGLLRAAQPPGLWRSALLDKPMESDGPVVLVFTGEAYSVEYPSDVNGVEHVAWCRITPYTRLTKRAECPHGKPSEDECIACNYTSTSGPGEEA